MEIEAGIDQLNLHRLEGLAVEENDYELLADQRLPVYTFQFEASAPSERKLSAKHLVFAMPGHAHAYIQSKAKHSAGGIASVGRLNFTRSKQEPLATVYENQASETILFDFHFGLSETDYDFEFAQWLLNSKNLAFDFSALSSVLILDTLDAEVDEHWNGNRLQSIVIQREGNLVSPRLSGVHRIKSGSKLGGIGANILSRLSLQIETSSESQLSLVEVLFFTPRAFEVTYNDMQSFEILRPHLPFLNVDITLAQAKPIITRLNNSLFSSAMFI